MNKQGNQYGIVTLGINDGFDNVPVTKIEYFPWDENGYCPDTYAQIYAGSLGFYVHMYTEETNLYATTVQQLEYVHIDSCMELFLMPYPDKDDRYFNFEVNPLGNTYCSVGNDRHNRQLLTIEDVALMNIRSTIVRGAHPQKAKWEIYFDIPYELIGRYFKVSFFSKGDRLLGNFYKCAENTPTPHFGCWNYIDVPKPDFHQSKFFGELILL